MTTVAFVVFAGVIAAAFPYLLYVTGGLERDFWSAALTFLVFEVLRRTTPPSWPSTQVQQAEQLDGEFRPVSPIEQVFPAAAIHGVVRSGADQANAF
jgi:hypothetical protein